MGLKTCKLPGFFKGRAVRKARRMHPCDGKGPNCAHVILRGEFYQEGEVDPDKAGGFGLLRHCLRCCPNEIASATDETQT
jgi:hypothetical protein